MTNYIDMKGYIDEYIEGQNDCQVKQVTIDIRTFDDDLPKLDINTLNLPYYVSKDNQWVKDGIQVAQDAVNLMMVAKNIGRHHMAAKQKANYVFKSKTEQDEQAWQKLVKHYLVVREEAIKKQELESANKRKAKEVKIIILSIIVVAFCSFVAQIGPETFFDGLFKFILDAISFLMGIGLIVLAVSLFGSPHIKVSRGKIRYKP